MMAIAIASFKEALKKKIILLVGLLTLVYLSIFTLIVYFAYSNISKNAGNNLAIFEVTSVFVSVLGFYFSSMLTAFLTIMASVGAVSSEVESGVIHGIITKPLARTKYVLGKYLGLAFLITAYAVFLYSSVIIICSVIGLPAVRQLSPAAIVKGLLLFVLEPLSILSLCIFGSVSFKTLSNGIFVIAIYILGLIGGMMEQLGSLIKNDALFKWGILSSLISPFDVIYREMLSVLFTTIGVTNPLFGPNFLSGTTPSVWMTVYIFLYLLGLLALALRKFGKKDIS